MDQQLAGPHCTCHDSQEEHQYERVVVTIPSALQNSHRARLVRSNAFSDTGTEAINREGAVGGVMVDRRESTSTDILAEGALADIVSKLMQPSGSNSCCLLTLPVITTMNSSSEMSGSVEMSGSAKMSGSAETPICENVCRVECEGLLSRNAIGDIHKLQIPAARHRCDSGTGSDSQQLCSSGNLSPACSDYGGSRQEDQTEEFSTTCYCHSEAECLLRKLSKDSALGSIDVDKTEFYQRRSKPQLLVSSSAESESSSSHVGNKWLLPSAHQELEPKLSVESIDSVLGACSRVSSNSLTDCETSENSGEDSYLDLKSDTAAERCNISKWQEMNDRLTADRAKNGKVPAAKLDFQSSLPSHSYAQGPLDSPQPVFSPQREHDVGSFNQYPGDFFEPEGGLVSSEDSFLGGSVCYQRAESQPIDSNVKKHYGRHISPVRKSYSEPSHLVADKTKYKEFVATGSDPKQRTLKDRLAEKQISLKVSIGNTFLTTDCEPTEPITAEVDDFNGLLLTPSSSTSSDLNSYFDELCLPATPRFRHMKDPLKRWQAIKGIMPFVDPSRRVHWIQLAGHAGSFEAGPQGTLLKKLCPVEQAALDSLMNDRLRHFVPKYYGITTKDGQQFIELQDLLQGFDCPAVMDCKMGTRTYQEEELTKAEKTPKPRKDMYDKMVKIDPDAPTAEEHRMQGVTKPRYMQWRESISSTSTLGLRIEGLKCTDGSSCKNFKTCKDIVTLKTILLEYTKGDKSIIRLYLERLKEMHQCLLQSDFFHSHEVVGSSLLFVHDATQAGIWMIDFGKTSPLPAGVRITHCTPWERGNCEDGYLIGFSNLMTLFESLLENSSTVTSE